MMIREPTPAQREQATRELYEAVKGTWRRSRFPNLMVLCQGVRYREWQDALAALRASEAK